MVDKKCRFLVHLQIVKYSSNKEQPKLTQLIQIPLKYNPRPDLFQNIIKNNIIMLC